MMATYLVSYDLTRPKEEDYPDLLNALRKDGAVRVLYSEWLVRSLGDAGAVANRYMAFMDANDRIFVTKVEGWAYFNIMNEESARPLLP